jgi:hypothetical protein
MQLSRTFQSQERREPCTSPQNLTDAAHAHPPSSLCALTNTANAPRSPTDLSNPKLVSEVWPDPVQKTKRIPFSGRHSEIHVQFFHTFIPPPHRSRRHNGRAGQGIRTHFVEFVLLFPAKTGLASGSFLCEDMKGLYQEAIYTARGMVRSSTYYADDRPLNTGRRPCSLGIRGARGRIEFWSLTQKLDPNHVYVDVPKVFANILERIRPAKI